MPHHPDVPELLEQYMEASGTQECWVTVRELRMYFGLDDLAGPAIAGFLQKIYQGPFFTFRYKVARIEKFRDDVPPYRVIRKYLVQPRPVQRNKKMPGDSEPLRQVH
ncbi:MAG: hypothetical protein WC379_16045 [Methanoregula sp.]|jgi:hypothetical protein